MTCPFEFQYHTGVPCWYIIRWRPEIDREKEIYRKVVLWVETKQIPKNSRCKVVSVHVNVVGVGNDDYIVVRVFKGRKAMITCLKSQPSMEAYYHQAFIYISYVWLYSISSCRSEEACPLLLCKAKVHMIKKSWKSHKPKHSRESNLEANYHYTMLVSKDNLKNMTWPGGYMSTLGTWAHPGTYTRHSQNITMLC